MFERCVFFNANALVRKINMRWKSAYSELGLSPSHAYLLRYVLNKPGANQQELAAALKLEKSTVTRFVSSLEREGLVTRKMADADQRINGIFPTQHGTELEAKLESIGEDLYTFMCKELGKENVKGFVSQLKDIEARI